MLESPTMLRRLWQRLLDVLDDIFNRPTTPLDLPFAM